MPLGGRLSAGNSTGQDVVNLIGGSSQNNDLIDKGTPVDSV